MASLFGRGFDPLHLHYVTMKGFEPFIVFLAPPSPLQEKSTKTKKAQLERLSLFCLEVRTRFERVYTVLQTVD